mgnify:CR=1 FL=1
MYENENVLQDLPIASWGQQDAAEAWAKLMDAGAEPVDTQTGPMELSIPAIKGIGGALVKPFGLANVRALHRELPSLPLIGCGGVCTAQDVKEYLAVA